MTPQEHAQLYWELADELYMICKVKPIDSPNYKRQSSLIQRARAAAEELELMAYPPLHRWNFELRDDGLYACRHFHEKGQPCQYERLTEQMVRDGGEK